MIYDPKIVFWQEPHVKRRIESGKIVEGPPIPDALYTQWKAAYQALPNDDAVKNPRAARIKRIQAIQTLDDVKRILLEFI